MILREQSDRRRSGETMFTPILLTHLSQAERNSAFCCPTFADITREFADLGRRPRSYIIRYRVFYFLLHGDGGLRREAAISAVPAVMVNFIEERG